LNDPGSRLANYSVTSTPAVLTITQAALAIVVNSASSTYGAAFPAFTGTLSGVVPGDGITARYLTAATPTSPIGGNYTITGTLIDPNNKLGNYSVVDTPGILSITGTALSVVVNSATSVYGSPFPLFTGSITGEVVGDGITATYSTMATPNSPPGGSYSISAILNDPNNKLDNYTVTITPAQLTIFKATPTIVLSSSINPVMLSKSTTLAATIHSSAGTPSGTITWFDSASPLGSAPLLNGAASLDVSTLTPGSHSLTVVYSGDTTFGTGASGVLTQMVAEITASAGQGGGTSSINTSQTVSAGGSATFSLSILPAGGASFPAATVLTVTGMPGGVNVTVSPTTWVQTSSTSWTYPADTTFSNVSLTIQLPAATARVDETPHQRKNPPLLWGLLLVPFAAKMRRRFKRTTRAFLLILLAICGAALTDIIGCGVTKQTVVNPPQTYSINETLSTGTQSYTAVFTLTVD
jgi:Bacterial Ig-like domain (group 3)/MBG domain (YGX type)